MERVSGGRDYEAGNAGGLALAKTCRVGFRLVRQVGALKPDFGLSGDVQLRCSGSSRNAVRFPPEEAFSFAEIPSCGPDTGFGETTVERPRLPADGRRLSGKEKCRLFSLNTDSTPSVQRLRQFRPIEVTTLEKRQRHFKNLGLASLKFEFLSTLRRGAACSQLLFLVLPTFGLLSNHNPSPTFRTCDARARNAIRHPKIILRLGQSTVDGSGGIPTF